MNDNDLIRRGDAKKIARAFCVGGYEGEIDEAFDALPAASATQHDFVQPTVKPLVWRTIQDKYDGGREHYGTGAFGHWYCVHRRKSGVWDIVHHVDGKPIHLEPCDTLDAAKSAAQADYEARILSVLDMHPTVSPELLAMTHDVAALVEALEWCIDALKQDYRGSALDYEIPQDITAALASVKGVM